MPLPCRHTCERKTRLPGCRPLRQSSRWQQRVARPLAAAHAALRISGCVLNRRRLVMVYSAQRKTGATAPSFEPKQITQVRAQRPVHDDAGHAVDEIQLFALQVIGFNAASVIAQVTNEASQAVSTICCNIIEQISPFRCGIAACELRHSVLARSAAARRECRSSFSVSCE
jgi:hypothetical protein